MSGMRRSMLIGSRMCAINVIAANTSLIDTEVIEGDSYNTQIVCDADYSIYEITIKMGGVDITSTAYDATYNMISIPSVIDDVDIECYAMHTLPSDYIRVDGIKNPSNAFMSTEYRMPAHSIAFVDCTRGNNNSSVGIFNSRPDGVIGTRSGGITFNSGVISVGAWPDSATYFGYASIGVTPAVGARFTVTLDKQNGKVLYNNVVKRTFTPNDTSARDASPMTLFASEKWSYGHPENSAGYIIHFASIKEENSYVRYYIPCLNASGVAGFWDAARGVFQGSSNSTAFEAIYVQDGLIFQLDGINKGPNADAWTDLKGGLVFTKYGNVTSISKGWDFPSADIHNGFLCSGSTLTGNGAPFTIECCYMPKSQNAAAIMGLHSSKGLAFAQSSGRYTFRQNYNRYSFAVSINTGHTVSLNNNIGIDNYVELEKSTVDSWTVNIGTGEITIGRFKDGSSSWSYPLYGELYAIRLYNRSLTKEEIMRNQAIDNARFGLGLTFPQTT